MLHCWKNGASVFSVCQTSCFIPPAAGTQLETVSEWKEALQLVMSEGVTGGECVSVLVRQLVVRGGPHFATKIISSVGVAGGGASGDEGVEIHSLLVHLSEVLAQQK